MGLMLTCRYSSTGCGPPIPYLTSATSGQELRKDLRRKNRMKATWMVYQRGLRLSAGQSMLRKLLSLTALLIVVGGITMPQPADAQEERLLTTPTAWWYYHGVTPAQLAQFTSNNQGRLIDIEVEQASPLRLTGGAGKPPEPIRTRPSGNERFASMPRFSQSIASDSTVMRGNPKRPSLSEIHIDVLSRMSRFSGGPGSGKSACSGYPPVMSNAMATLVPVT